MRKKPRQSRSRALVNAIAAAADQVLRRGEDHEDAVTVQAIAERAGVGIGSVYDYFNDKDALLGLVLTRVTQENYRTLASEVEQPSEGLFDERLRDLARAVVDAYLKSPGRTRTLLRVAARFRLEGAVIKARDRFAEMLAERLLADEPHLDREEIVRASVFLCDATMGIALAESWREPDATRREQLAEEMAEMALRYLAPLRARLADDERDTTAR